MLADLKVSSLTCKRVFYSPEHNSKGGYKISDLSVYHVYFQSYGH